MRRHMQYETIDEDLIRAFPELAGPKARLHAEWGDEKPGQYILFEDVFRPYVSCLLAASAGSTKGQRLRAVFSFVEGMLSSGGEIENLGFISQLEGQTSWWLQLAKPYLGPQAEAALDEFDITWRERALSNSSRLETERSDLYGVKEVAANVLQDESAT